MVLLTLLGTFQENIIRNYYWLSDSDHPNLELRHIDNTIAADFPLQFDEHYNILLGGADSSHSINWFSIQNAFTILHNWRNNNSNNNLIKKALGYIILVTSEALRFRSVFNLILNNIIEGYSNIYWNPAENSDHTNVRAIVTNWQSISNNIIDAINNIQVRFGNINEVINESFYNLLSQLPLNTITQALANTDVKIILGLLMHPTLNCDRRTRSINNNIKNEYCDAIKGTEQNYPLKNKKITSVKILDENNKGDNLKSGDIFVGTTEGLYFVRKNEVVLKVDNIDNDKNDHTEITSIKEFGNGNFYVFTNDEKVYFLNTKLINDEHIIGEILWNAESSNLEKELKLYYDKNKENKKLDFESTLHNYWNTKSFLLNLDKINPVENFNKIEFLGDTDNNCWGTMVNWGSWVYTNNCKASWGKVKKLKGQDINSFLKDKNNNFKNIIENTKNNVPQNKEQELQKFWDKDGEAKIEINQRFGLTWYWENNKYYLKVFGLQYCEWWASGASLNCHMKLGNGIRLYNN